MNLQKFLEPIKLAGTPLKNRQAYRMDSTSSGQNMRQEVGLGTCNCCDYFMIGADNTIILIEETQLVKQIKGLKSKFHYLKSTDQKQFIDKYIQQENRVKAYGSMLVLCRLAAICSQAKNLLGTKKYKFWLVVTGMNAPQDTRFLNQQKLDLSKVLKDVLTKKIVDDVAILPSTVFVNKLSQHATTP